MSARQLADLRRGPRVKEPKPVWTLLDGEGHIWTYAPAVIGRGTYVVSPAGVSHYGAHWMEPDDLAGVLRGRRRIVAGLHPGTGRSLI